jgi:hypothetical protein
MMPLESKAQARTMQAVAHGWKPTGSARGITPTVAREYIAKTKTPFSQLPARAGGGATKVRDAYQRTRAQEKRRPQSQYEDRKEQTRLLGYK